jgi:hypothetical protein
MIVCTSCGSSRIRSDYRPAPWYLRAIGIRALLCDYCNRQFRAFSWRAPKGRGPKAGQRKADVFLGSTPRKEETHGAEAISAEPDRSLLLTILRSNELSEVPDAPRKGLREEIAQRQSGTEGVPAKTDVPDAIPPDPLPFPSSTIDDQSEEARSSPPGCPACGSGRVRRRPRTTVERVALSLTRHRAYHCRDCQTSFYHRGNLLASEDGTGPKTDGV